jgi:hypothetical protein
MNPRDLIGRSRRELAALARTGAPFDPAALAGARYEGISLGLPRLVERLTWTKFAKAFHRDPASGRLRGWNIRVVQDALDQPWRDRTRDGVPVTFGHFAVERRGDEVVLDYGVIRDPLVALAGTDVLLGRSLVAVAGVVVGTPSWFVLRRAGPVDHVPPAPVRQRCPARSPITAARRSR